MKMTSWMKTALVVVCALAGTAAFGQSFYGNAPVLNNQPPQMLDMPYHPEHASQQSMATEQNLLGSHSYSYAQGERPLWEVSPLAAESLGDAARRLREEHAKVRKSAVVYIN
jgi:hypothetical protein